MNRDHKKYTYLHDKECRGKGPDNTPKEISYAFIMWQDNDLQSWLLANGAKKCVTSKQPRRRSLVVQTSS